jgi:hypothetical protein
MRDLDGTGSLHVCAEGDPGAIPVYAALEQDVVTKVRTALEATLAFAEALEKQSSQGTGGRRGGHIFTKARSALALLSDKEEK